MCIAAAVDACASTLPNAAGKPKPTASNAQPITGSAQPITTSSAQPITSMPSPSPAEPSPSPAVPSPSPAVPSPSPAVPSPSPTVPSPSPVSTPSPPPGVATCGDISPAVSGNQSFDCSSMGEFVLNVNMSSFSPPTFEACCMPKYSCIDINPEEEGCQPWTCDESRGWYV
ncbi:hypothetical protein COO60DRAFT_1673252, partial [Scenedesmus sp. NREL 46B-D3]